MIDMLKQLWCSLFGHRKLKSFWVRDERGAVRLDYCPRCEDIMNGEVIDLDFTSLRMDRVRVE